MADLLARVRRFPRLALAHLLTPMERMPRLGAELGLESVRVKRDDCTGRGLGGNKVRKLEFGLAAALEARADCVVCGGVVQSNAARQVAAACAKIGIECHLGIMRGRPAKTEPGYEDTGNILLDRRAESIASAGTEPFARDAVLSAAARNATDAHAMSVGKKSGLKKVFFGWHVVGAAFTVALFAWGIGFYGPPIFLAVLHRSRGWPVSLISAAITAHFLLGAWVVANLATLHRRFGMQAVTRTGAVLTALGLLGWALSRAPWELSRRRR